MNSKITTKPYFWIALISPLFLSIISTIIIYDQSLHFCLTKACLDNFIKIFNIPLSLLGLSFVTTGIAFAYYKIEISYEQNERQISQHTQTNYNLFKTEFITLLNEKAYKFEIIDIPNHWLFSALYPDAKKGNHTLNPDFEEFITYSEHHQGFNGAMNSLTEALGSTGVVRYSAASYQHLTNLFLWLREIITLDADHNFSFVSGASFTDDYSKVTIGTIRDIFFIVSTVNAFEGWRFFDNKQRRIWRKSIDRLSVIADEASQIQEYIKIFQEKGLLNHLIRGEIDKFKETNIIADMPDNLRNNEHAKRYIFEVYTTNHFDNILNEDAAQALAESLNLKTA